MFKGRWFFLSINLKAIAGLISCLLIVCLTARSMLPRPVVQSRLHSILTMSKVAEVESNDPTDTSEIGKPATILKRVRDEKIVKDPFIALSRIDFSQYLTNPNITFSRISFYSDCFFLSSCTRTIDKPPKV